MFHSLARILLIITCIIASLSPFSVAHAASAPGLEISELLPDPAAPLTDAADEFIEFHNLTGEPIDLAGYTIKTVATATTNHVLASAIVPANGYLALKSATTKISLANTGSTVSLLDPAKAQMGDAVTYKTAPTGSSWNKPDTGVWGWSTTPTPGEANQITTAGKGSSDPTSGDTSPSPAESPELQLTELLPDPAAPLTDAADEFIEIYNPNNFPVDLSGYSIKSGSSLTTKHVLTSTIIQPNSYVALKSATTKIALANAGSSVALFDPSGAQIGATVTYPAAKSGVSWARDGEAWSWSSTPTPGAANIIAAVAASSTTAAKSTSTKSTTAKTSTTKAKATAAPKAAKSSKASTTKSTSPLVAGATSTGGHWLLFTLAALTIGYIIYEFRYDIRNYYFQLRGYPVGRPAPVPATVGRGSDRAGERPGRG